MNTTFENKRYFKVLEGAEFGFNIDFTGQILELISTDFYKEIENYYCLKQPERDNNNKPCFGIVFIGLDKLEEFIK